MIYMRACGTITYTSIICCTFHISIVAVPILFNDAIIVHLVTQGGEQEAWEGAGGAEEDW